IKLLDQKQLYGFHCAAKLGTKKTIISVTHSGEMLLMRAKRELRGFQSTDGIMVLYKIKQKRERNYVKIAIVSLLLLGGVGLVGAGVGYYLYTQTDLFSPDKETDTSLMATLGDDHVQTLEVDIETLTALKESFEKHEKSESEKATMQAMVVATDVISQMVPDSLKDQYSSEEVVRKFKGQGGINLVVKEGNTTGDAFDKSVAELNEYAMNYAQNNEYTTAIDYYQQAIESEDDNASARLESYANQGELYAQTDQLSEAKIAYEKARETSEQLSQEDRPRYQNTQAWTEAKLSGVYQDLNQTQDAEEALKEAEKIYLKTVALFAKLAKSDPTTHRQNLAWAYNMLANFYHNDTQEIKASIEARQKALDIYRDLAAKQALLFFERLFMTYNSLALSYQELNEYPKAQASYQKSFELTQEARDQGLENPKEYLAQALNQLGVIYTKQEQYNPANKHLKQSEKLYKELMFEDSHRFQAYLLGVQQDIAACYAQQQEYAKASRLYEEVIDKYQILNAQDPMKLNAPLAKALNSLAWIRLMDEKHHDTQQARQLLRKSLHHAKALEQSDRKRSLSLGATSHIYLAYLALHEGSMKEAFEHYDQALTLHPNYETAKSYLLLLVAKKNLMKANTLFTSMLEEYTSPEHQAELWMMYGKFYMEIDKVHAKLKLERALALYHDLNDTLKIEAIRILMNQADANNTMVQ
ncbi:MAG TPA: tetratricopeptide repeat protein, partial [Campylobacterales bacterium]|nr:tetratricopeptide repeat protein [Campylobacterales bacterium]